ncbi:hypothetical protein [Ferruginibacter sp. HRS2-29]|uniref:hypothetical protein n=1 Tax=Ferruginibacter sp. HRS2-29 TaxID=2487334 RepID=UPI0020CCA487|nr:hypothetical protein [Ferruginibacter sp. HRS2-29]MCP9751732.1 hypothetical protein [Ferruginibacter sp. HRS2-29]
MKTRVIFLLIICMLLNCGVRAQFRELDIQDLHFNNSKPVRIFFTALWCSPCMGKYKIVQENFAKDTSFNNLMLFDASGFSREKLKKITPEPFDSLRSYIIPYRYYKVKGPVVINLSSKALKRFVTSLKKEYPGNGQLSFWYGDMIVISTEGRIEMEKVEKGW